MPRTVDPADARPGDVVYLKPQKIYAIEGGRFYIEADWVRPDEIERIERTPRPLQVGDTFMLPDYGLEARAEAIVGNRVAWTREAHSVTIPACGWCSLEGLEPLND